MTEIIDINEEGEVELFIPEDKVPQNFKKAINDIKNSFGVPRRLLCITTSKDTGKSFLADELKSCQQYYEHNYVHSDYDRAMKVLKND